MYFKFQFVSKTKGNTLHFRTLFSTIIIKEEYTIDKKVSQMGYFFYFRKSNVCRKYLNHSYSQQALFHP